MNRLQGGIVKESIFDSTPPLAHSYKRS